MGNVLQELSKVPPGALAAIAALAGATGAILAAIVTAMVGKLIVTPFLSARDKQDREVEWRKHAIELTKLDLERKLRTRSPADTRPVRPSILDFLANYRDIQELGAKSPRDLYQDIESKRISVRPPGQPAVSVSQEASPAKASLGDDTVDQPVMAVTGCHEKDRVVRLMALAIVMVLLARGVQSRLQAKAKTLCEEA